jgi:hypothetical protein
MPEPFLVEGDVGVFTPTSPSKPKLQPAALFGGK